MSTRGLPVTIVRACLRDGSGGSPTAVLMDGPPLDDGQRRRVPALAGTSHAVFVSAPRSRSGGTPVSLRFFTSEGELPACGHGTVAALAFLSAHAGRPVDAGYRTTLHASGRIFEGWSVPDGTESDTGFEPGPVDLREPPDATCGTVLAALGVTRDVLAPGAVIASVGRPRLLLPVTSRSVLASLAPDLAALRAACDRFGLLGCYVHSVPEPTGRTGPGAVVRAAARMFAPSIGVPEDIANANSTACLAAHLAGRGVTGLAVDMGDSLGVPATVTATTTATAWPGPAAPLVHVGGTARLTGVVRLP